MSEAAELMTDSSEQVLAFRVGPQEYAVDILRVQEIRGWEPTTPLPNAPIHVKGVINLRGAIIPIIDLREKFGATDVHYERTTVVVVLKVRASEKERTVGVVVDSVNEVLQVSQANIEPPPDWDSVGHLDFVRGIASVQERLLFLLEIDRLLAG